MGVAVKVTVVPRGKEATQAEEQEMPPGLLVTMPLPGPEVFTDKVTKSGAGVAGLIAIFDPGPVESEPGSHSDREGHRALYSLSCALNTRVLPQPTDRTAGAITVTRFTQQPRSIG